MKGKHYTYVSHGNPVPYTCANNCLHVGALQATCTRDSTRAYSQYLGVVEISESTIVEIGLRFDEKLQQATVDWSEGEGELRAS